MTCGACTSAIENNLASKPGILSIVVSLPLNSVKVEFNQTMVGPRDIVEWMEETGFDVILAGNNDAAKFTSVPGEKVHADGTVIWGSSTIDESTVTREPLHSDPERTNSGSFTLGNLPAHVAGGRRQILNCSSGRSRIVNYNSCYSGP